MMLVASTVMEWLGGAGLLFGLLAPILVPLYYLAVCVQVFLGHRWRISTSKRVLFPTIITAETLAPALYFLIYLVMPGSTWRGEPIGASEKALNTAGATGVLCVAVFCVSILFLLRARISLRQ